MAIDLTITIDDRIGKLAALGTALGDAGVNIEGMCGIAHEGQGIIHLCVENAWLAQNALEAAGVKVEGESDAIVIDMSGDEDRPGALGAVARTLADADVSVRTAYLATRSRGVFVTSDNARALAVLEGSDD